MNNRRTVREYLQTREGVGKGLLRRRASWWAPCTLMALAGVPVAAQDPPSSREQPVASQFSWPDTIRSRIILENDLVGFVVPDGRTPVVSFTAIVRGGTGDDRRQGAAELLGHALATRGPCWMVPGHFEETLRELAADFLVSMTPEMTELTLNVGAEDAEEGLRVFAGIVRETCLDEESLAAFRQATARRVETAGALSAGPLRGDVSQTTAMGVFRDTLFATHEYHSPITNRDAQQLEVADGERFYRDYFTPTNIVLAVSGAFNVREMVLLVDQRFADWERRRAPSFRRADQIESLTDADTVRIRADQPASWIVMGHELPAMPPRDFVAVEVMNFILGGGHADARLFQGARDRRSVSNAASGYLEPGLRGPGTYTIRASSRPEAAGELIRIVLREIERLQREPVTAEELQAAKGALADGAFSRRFENGHTTARTLAWEWARYLTFDHLANYQDWVRGTSARDVQRAAERYLHPERMRVVIIGPMGS